MRLEKVVRAKRGDAVVSPTETIEIRGTWTVAELMKVVSTIEQLTEVDG